MTAPGVQQVAGWDITRVRVAIAGLRAVQADLPGWRGRLESVIGELGEGPVWSGPAATVASVAVTELATTLWAVGSGFAASLDSMEQVAREASSAQEWAEQALALAVAADITLAPDGSSATPVPAPKASMAADQSAALQQRLGTATRPGACAEEAVGHALLAAAAAAAAGEALRGLGAQGTAVPADFAGLAAAAGTAGPGRVPAVPRARTPQDAAAWWAALSPAEHAAALDAAPASLGDLDGLPAEVRDRANRRLLAAALADPRSPGHALAVVVAAQLAGQQCGDRAVQLYEFDPGAGLVVVSLGDLDSAAAVGVLVPGMNTTPEDDLGSVLGEAHRVLDSVEVAAGGTAVATVAWLGYRSPQSIAQAATTGAARRGGAALDRTLAGLAADRQAAGSGPPRVTVLAHSYGTVVAHEAAHRPGRLAANAVVLMGSPGMGRDGARGMEAAEVYDAWSPADPVSYLGWFGEDAQAPDYGAIELPVDPRTPHTGYYDAGGPTVAALGRVVVGTG